MKLFTAVKLMETLSQAATTLTEQQPPDDASVTSSIDDVDKNGANPDVITKSLDVVSSQVKRIEGPLGPFVRSALQQLDVLQRRSDGVDESRHDGEDDDVTILQRICADLVTSYGELSVDERLEADRQLVDVVYQLTTRGLDVNVVCDVEKRRTALHVVAAIPGSAKFV